jgi:hypothetical protein
MEPDIIYQEKFATKGFIAILSPIAALMLIILLYHLFIESAEPFILMTAFFLVMFIFFVILTLGFSTFTIAMTSETITIGFGIKKHKTPLTQIIECHPDEVSAAKYGGFGIKVARVKGKNRLVYNTIGTPRVVLSLNEGKFPEFAFSTKNPEEVVNVLRAQLSLVK